MADQVVTIAHPATRFVYFKAGVGKYERHHMADVDALDAVTRYPNDYSFEAPDSGTVYDKVPQAALPTAPEPGAAPAAGQISQSPVAGLPVGLAPPSEVAAELRQKDDLILEKDQEIARLQAELAAKGSGPSQGGADDDARGAGKDDAGGDGSAGRDDPRGRAPKGSHKPGAGKP